MRRQALDAPSGRLAAPAQFKGEHDAGELRLAVDRHRLVAPLGLQVVEVDCSITRRHTAEGDDARIPPLLQQWQQMPGGATTTQSCPNSTIWR